MTAISPIVRTRRANWFEPTFDPALKSGLTAGDWCLPDHAAVKRLFTAESLTATAVEAGLSTRFKKITFTKCDFAGSFDQVSSVIVFDDCTFINCDFGLSTWARAKFTRCKFQTASFTQSTWKYVDFRFCTWSNIGVSGNETNFDEVYISNPLAFVQAVSTNVSDIALATGNANRRSQVTRLQETKATVARNIFNNLKTVGDEDTFYEGCRALLQQTCCARQARPYGVVRSNSAKIGERLKSAFALLRADLETLLVLCFGGLTKWGGSITRPLLCLGGVVLSFWPIYHFFAKLTWWDYFQHSFDIATITGYGRAVLPESGGNYLYLAWIELVLSILFYTIFFTVAVSKISRVR